MERIARKRAPGPEQGASSAPQERKSSRPGDNLARSSTSLSLISVVLPFLLMPGLAAQDWPQWRGPSSQGVSSESGLPTHWGVGHNIAWKASLAGLGASSPIVWGERVFVTSQTGSASVRQGSHPQLARDDRSLALAWIPTAYIVANSL